MMFEKIHVYDLDGVLVDTSHRYRNKPDGTIDLDFWFANRTPEKIMQDKLLPLADNYIEDCENPKIYTVICTSRMEYIHDIKFISERLGFPNKLIMRPQGDMSADGPLKRRSLSRLFNLKQFAGLPRYFWDDNKKNLEATRDLFTRVFHVHSKICEDDNAS